MDTRTTDRVTPVLSSINNEMYVNYTTWYQRWLRSQVQTGYGVRTWGVGAKRGGACNVQGGGRGVENCIGGHTPPPPFIEIKSELLDLGAASVHA